MEPVDQSDYLSYHPILFRSSGSEILLRQSDAGLVLPEIAIPRWHRAAERLTAFLQETWGIEAICLFPLKKTSQVENSEPIRYQVMELCSNVELDCNFRWISVGAIKEQILGAKDNRLPIQEAFEKCALAKEPFSRFGWFTELKAWISEVVHPLGLKLSGSFRQLNASPTFSLIRLETSGPAVWFKAVGEPNLREFAITSTLATLFPTHVPRMLGIDPACNGWLSLEAAGVKLTDFNCLAEWQSAAASLAQLQVDSIAHQQQLLQAGARSLKLTNLSQLLAPFLSSMRRVMEEQRPTAPPPLSVGEILFLEKQIQAAINVVSSLSIPDTLGHLDLNPGNIIFSSTDCIFLDWAETYVGSPFLSLEYLLEHCRRAGIAPADYDRRIKATYAAVWRDRLPERVIAEAMRWTSLLAVFAYAIAIAGAFHHETAPNPSAAAYLRALGRRMKREADQLLNRETLCLN